MVKKIISSYFELLDEKLENGTLVVLIIAALVVLVAILINDMQMKKSNIIEKTIYEIDGRKYKLIEE